MKTQFLSKAFLSIATLALTLCAGNAAVAKNCDYVTCAHVESYPYLGLVMDEVQYGPITIKDVSLNDHDRVTTVKPGETVKGHVKYKIDSDELDTLHLHHIIVGLKNVGAQDCIAHSFGVWDSKGRSSFELKAPMEKGVYEVRFSYAQASSCSEALKSWTEDNHQPSSKATIAILIVE